MSFFTFHSNDEATSTGVEVDETAHPVSFGLVVFLVTVPVEHLDCELLENI